MTEWVKVEVLPSYISQCVVGSNPTQDYYLCDSQINCSERECSLLVCKIPCNIGFDATSYLTLKIFKKIYSLN